MASDEENDYNSDEEINSAQHSRFLEDVLQLDKKQFVKKPTRTEPTSHVSEFNLVKSLSTRENIVNIGDLTKTLDKKKKHVQVSNKIKSTQNKVGTLRKPLEKPQRERIKRSVGFKEVSLDLKKWDPIVMKNRVSAQLFFPLNEGKMNIHKSSKGNKMPFNLKTKSKLDEELEKLEQAEKLKEAEKTEVEKEENPMESFPLTMKEILEKRREMARLRAQQSYQEAKYHRQNKIKSKKFHRIQRKEKIKNQIKDFEKLQKSDPEEALRKLEEIERARAEERMSLRHRSTGQWAKSKLVRAKYDKESRQILAQQLAISRDLTQKLQTGGSSSESEDESALVNNSSDQSNPWVNGVKTEQEINDFVTGYRKYWDEQNKIQQEEQINENNIVETNENDGSNGDNISIDENISENIEKTVSVSKTEKTKKKSKVDPEKEKRLMKKLKSLDLSAMLGQKLNSKKIKKQLNLSSTSEWDVESLNEEREEDNIDEMFDDLEIITRSKLKNKLKNVQTDIDKNTTDDIKMQTKKRKINKNETTNKKKSKTKDFMELPREKYRPELDEELTMDDITEKPTLRQLSQSIQKTPEKVTQNNENSSKKADIDPNQYINIKPTHLDTFLPNNIELGDDNQSDDGGGASEDGGDQRDIITEAFAGDDVVSDFAKEKKDAVDSDKPKDVDLTLPGWGSWGGKDIKISKRKKRRFIVKFPKKMPRRDENKGQVIINEAKNEKLNPHLVSEVPFPFRSVKDFEASIRAPIGDTFLPQTAFRRLIKPSIVTKKGEIIKPMDDEVLVKNKFTKSGKVVKIN